MIQRMKFLAVAAIAAVLVACGGGGDSSDGTPQFAGNYDISVGLISNNCNAAVPGTIAGGQTITQSGRTITIADTDLTMVGTVDSDNGGFSVTNSQVSSGVTVLTVFNFRTVTDGSKYAVQVTITAAPCSAVYTGTATKI